jgi:hypothetical protein
MEPYLVTGFVILGLILHFWALIDLMKSRLKKNQSKIFWFFIVIILPIIGAIIYFQVKRNITTQKETRFSH